MRAINLVLALALLPGCAGYYYSGHGVKEGFVSVLTDYGLDHNQVGNSTTGGIVRDANGNVIVTESKSATANGSNPSITMASGARITGTINQTQSAESIGDAVEDVTRIKAIRKVWGEAIGASENVLTEGIDKIDTQ